MDLGLNLGTNGTRQASVRSFRVERFELVARVLPFAAFDLDTERVREDGTYDKRHS